MVDVTKPESPAWWLHLLLGRLLKDQPRLVLMDRYYRGHHPLPHVPRELTREFRTMLARAKSNFMRLPVEAPAQRMAVQGFRAPSSEESDQAAWDRWRASGMDARSSLSIIDSLSMGRSYLSVWRPSASETALIQVEDPRGTLVAYDQRDRRKRAAGLRVWIDEWTGKLRADVWLPDDACYSFIARGGQVPRSEDWPTPWEPAYPIDQDGVARVSLAMAEEPFDVGNWGAQWEPFGEPIPNPFSVPIVEIVNRPSVAKWPDGESEIDDVIAAQDRINELLFSLHLAAWTTAYRQKWATGLEIPVDEKTGKPIQPFAAAVDRLWISESEDTRFGDFSATDLKPYIDSIEQVVQHIAVQTQVPRHYFQVSGQEPSGDSIKSAEAGLIAKVRDKQPLIGAAFAEAQQLAALMEGADVVMLETVWADPENRTMAETTDAVIKQYSAGLITRREAQERLGYSPTQIARMESELIQQELLAEVAAQAEGPVPEPPVIVED